MVVEEGRVEQSEEPYWRELGFDTWSKFRRSDLRRLEDGDVGELEKTLIREMRERGFDKAKTSQEIQADIAARNNLKRLKRPPSVDQLRENIELQNQNYHRYEEKQAELVRTKGHEELDLRARQLADQALQRWENDRWPKNAMGKPVAYKPEHQEKIDTVNEKKAEFGTQRGHQQEFAFFQWLERAQPFGESTELEVHPTSQYDDYNSGIDGIALLKIPDAEQGSRTIALGIDFTTQGDEISLAHKLSRIAIDPVGELTYGTKHLMAGQHYMRTVVSLDSSRMQRLQDHMFSAQAAKEAPADSLTAKAGAQLGDVTKERNVFSAQVLDEVYEQVAWGRELLAEQKVPTEALADHDALLAHLAEVRKQNEDLRAQVHAEVGEGGRASIYRTSDAGFIRRSAEAGQDAAFERRVRGARG